MCNVKFCLLGGVTFKDALHPSRSSTEFLFIARLLGPVGACKATRRSLTSGEMQSASLAMLPLWSTSLVIVLVITIYECKLRYQ